MKFLQTLIERKKEEKKPVFIETDEKSPFPNDTMTAIKKKITSLSKDLEEEWDSAVTLLNTSFEELDVPIPQAYSKDRWQQYTELLAYAIKQLYDSRGFSGKWHQKFINT